MIAGLAGRLAWRPAPKCVPPILHPTSKGPSMASTKRRKNKLQPVTSGSKPSTPRAATSLNLNLPSIGEDDPSAKSHSEPGPCPVDLTSQSASSSPSSSTQKTEEREPELDLHVIGTPAFPSLAPTPAPNLEPKPKASYMSSPTPTPLSPPVTVPKSVQSVEPEPFRGGEEFIAFAFSDSDEDTAAVPIREWDQGKENGDFEKRGKKRKSGEMSRDDREYDRDGRRERGHHRDRDRDGEKRWRMENVSRYTPWVANVDWERCANVSEL